MPLVLIDPYSVNWHHVRIDLKRGETVPDGELANYLVETGAPVEQVVDEPPFGPDRPGDDWTVAQVLAWVDEDTARAATALEVEEAKTKPRSTLVDELRKRVQQ